MRWPTLFVSHGSPMLAIEPGRTGPALAAWARTLPETPRGILVISPHWMGAGLALSTRTDQTAWHDFGGFPPQLYQLDYAPPGSPLLAARTSQLLTEAGSAPVDDPSRHLDHGAWVPLRFLYPRADIPVVQLSLDAGRDAAAQLALGRQLAPLRDENILIIGSGSLTHNLRDVQPAHDAPALPYVRAFQDWAAGKLAGGDVDALLRWEQEAPGARQAHPHEDHLMPLYVALGAAMPQPSGTAAASGISGMPTKLGAPGAERLNDEVSYGALAMDAYAFSDQAASN